MKQIKAIYAAVTLLSAGCMWAQNTMTGVGIVTDKAVDGNNLLIVLDFWAADASRSSGIGYALGGKYYAGDKICVHAGLINTYGGPMDEGRSGFDGSEQIKTKAYRSFDIGATYFATSTFKARKAKLLLKSEQTGANTITNTVLQLDGQKENRLGLRFGNFYYQNTIERGITLADTLSNGDATGIHSTMLNSLYVGLSTSSFWNLVVEVPNYGVRRRTITRNLYLDCIFGVFGKNYGFSRSQMAFSEPAYTPMDVSTKFKMKRIGGRLGFESIRYGKKNKTVAFHVCYEIQWRPVYTYPAPLPGADNGFGNKLPQFYFVGRLGMIIGTKV